METSPPPGPLTVLRGDARSLALPDESVDLVVTSPPYWGLRSYKDGGEHYEGQVGAEASPEEFLRALWSVMDEMWRVLRPGGSVWVNLGDNYCGYKASTGVAHSFQQDGPRKPNTGGARVPPSGRRGIGHYPVRNKSLTGLPWRFALGCIDPDERRQVECPWFLPSEVSFPQWVLRAEVIWAKPNGLPESVKDRVARKHEQWFHLTKSERYYTAVDLIREPHTSGRKVTATAEQLKAWQKGAQGRLNGDGTTAVGVNSTLPANALGKLPGSVWTVATEPLPSKAIKDAGFEAHYAAFPSEFPRRIILGWAPTRGICETCGEGLRPVVSKAQLATKEFAKGQALARTSTPGGDGSHSTLGHAAGTATLTGWECACGPDRDPTDGTRPAVVLDPFGGTGTAAIVASALGCHGITNDMSADYCRLAQWRHDDGRLARKVRERTWPAPKRTPRRRPPVVTDQLALFEGLAS